MLNSWKSGDRQYCSVSSYTGLYSAPIKIGWHSPSPSSSYYHLPQSRSYNQSSQSSSYNRPSNPQSANYNSAARCHNCGGKTYSSCQVQTRSCHFCDKRGHFQSVCRAANVHKLWSYLPASNKWTYVHLLQPMLAISWTKRDGETECKERHEVNQVADCMSYYDLQIWIPRSSELRILMVCASCSSSKSTVA